LKTKLQRTKYVIQNYFIIWTINIWTEVWIQVYVTALYKSPTLCKWVLRIAFAIDKTQFSLCTKKRAYSSVPKIPNQYSLSIYVAGMQSKYLWNTYTRRLNTLKRWKMRYLFKQTNGYLFVFHVQPWRRMSELKCSSVLPPCCCWTCMFAIIRRNPRNCTCRQALWSADTEMHIENATHRSVMKFHCLPTSLCIT